MKRILMALISLALLLGLLIPAISCQETTSVTPTHTPAIAASAKIGSSGGTVEVADSSNSLYRVSLKIPNGSLAQEVTVTVCQAEGNPLIPEGSVIGGVGIRLGPEGLVFQEPVSISIPYSEAGIDEDTIGVYEYNPTEQTLRIMPIESIDLVNNIITVQTFSFSDYYPIALQKGFELPPQPATVTFNPKADRLDTLNFGNCYGEVSFVEWFWENKTERHLEDNLANWFPERHGEIAKIAQCTTAPENKALRYIYNRDSDPLNASYLMQLISNSHKPQIVGFAYKQGNETGHHAVLAYNYTVIQSEPKKIKFDLYDPNVLVLNGKLTKKGEMTYDGAHIIIDGYDDGGVLGYLVIGLPEDPQALEFVYEYIKNKPEITNESPIGETKDKRPTLSATIHYPFIDPDLIDYAPVVEMQLDGTKVVPITKSIDTHNLMISFAPTVDLAAGDHTVYVSGQGYYSKVDVSGVWCAPPKDDNWTFTVKDEKKPTPTPSPSPTSGTGEVFDFNALPDMAKEFCDSGYLSKEEYYGKFEDKFNGLHIIWKGKLIDPLPAWQKGSASTEKYTIISLMLPCVPLSCNNDYWLQVRTQQFEDVLYNLVAGDIVTYRAYIALKLAPAFGPLGMQDGEILSVEHGTYVMDGQRRAALCAWP